MKKHLGTIALLIMLMNAPTSANAIIVTCTNCSLSVKQLLELAKETITAAETHATAFNTYATYLKATVVEPLQNTLIASALLTQQANTINLITGGLNGQPLLQSNPEQWIKNQGLNVVRLSLGDIEKANGLYSGSILNALTSAYKQNSLQNALTSLSNSSIPRQLQDNFCLDANLTAVATNDVSQAGPPSPQAIQARKQELWNQLCKNSATVDPSVSARLMEASKQRPDIGGWDTWLATTVGGENEYNRTIQAKQLIDEAKNTRENTSRDDYNNGKGVVSATTCKDTVSPEDTNIANIPCRVSQITNSSGALSALYNQALVAPVQKLIASSGVSGTGIFGTLSTLLSAKNTIDTFKNAFGSISGGSGLGIAAGSNTGATSSVNLREWGSSENKDLITNSINTITTKYLEAFARIEAADKKIGESMGKLNEQKEGVSKCYEEITRLGYIEPDGDEMNQLVTAFKKFDSGVGVITAGVGEDAAKIAKGRQYIQEIQLALGTAQTGAELNAAFTTFSNRLSEIPDESTAGQREGQIQQAEQEVTRQSQEGGELYDAYQKCLQIQLAHYDWSGNKP